MNTPPKKTLEYRAPDRDGPGCGLLVVETLGGIMALGFCAGVGASLHAQIGGGLGIAAMLIAFALGFAAMLVLALRRHPGFLIGFILAGGVLIFLNILCGGFV